MHIVVASLILGVVAVWGVPLVTSLLKSILPDAASPYLPPTTTPAFSMQSAITALVYGALVFLTLIALEATAKLVTHKTVRAGV